LLPLSASGTFVNNGEENQVEAHHEIQVQRV
jgi:hypothetical protein